MTAIESFVIKAAAIFGLRVTATDTRRTGRNGYERHEGSAMTPRRGDVILASVLALIVVANVLLFVYFRPSHARQRPATTASTPVRATAKPHVARARPSTTAAPPRHAHRSHLRHGERRSALVVDATRGSSWILVRRLSATGPVLYEGVLGRGRALRFAQKAVYVRISSIANVDVRLGRLSLDLRCSAAGGVLVTGGVAVAQGPPSCATGFGS